MLFLIVAARILGPANFGIYILLFTLTEMVALITGAGFGDFVTRELSSAPADAYQFSVRITQLRLLYSLATGVVMLAILLLLGYSWAVLRLSLLMLATLFPRAILETSQGALRAVERFRSFAALDIVQGLSLLAVGSYLFHRGFGLAAAVWTEVAAVTVAAVAALLVASRSFARTGGARPCWREIVRRTLPFNVYPFIVQMYDRIDVVLLAKLASNAAVGVYSVPYRLYASLQIFPYGILGTLLPRLSRSEWGADTQRLSRRILDLLYGSALLVVLLTNLAAPAVIVILGRGYEGSATALRILIWATVPMFLNYGLNTFLLANRREKVFLITATVCILVNVGANLLLIPRYSFRAAAAVTVLTEAVLLAQNLFWVRRTLGQVLLPQNFLRTSAFFAGACAIGFAASRYLSQSGAALITLTLFAVYLCATAKSFVRLT